MDVKIKNIVFDFGGILLDLDYDETYQAFSRLLERDIKRSNLREVFGQHLDDFEKGKMNDESFLWKFQHMSKKPINPIDIIKSWNAMLLGIRPEILPFLKKIKENYNSYILSNTNSIHIQYVKYQILEKQLNERNWDQYFDRIYYSHEIGHRKPEADIYHTIQNAEQLNPAETLFIDDLLENVEAARACGWHAVQHDPADRIEEKLMQYISSCENI